MDMGFLMFLKDQLLKIKLTVTRSTLLGWVFFSNKTERLKFMKVII